MVTRCAFALAFILPVKPRVYVHVKVRDGTFAGVRLLFSWSRACFVVRFTPFLSVAWQDYADLGRDKLLGSRLNYHILCHLAQSLQPTS